MYPGTTRGCTRVLCVVISDLVLMTQTFDDEYTVHDLFLISSFPYQFPGLVLLSIVVV